MVHSVWGARFALIDSQPIRTAQRRLQTPQHRHSLGELSDYELQSQETPLRQVIIPYQGQIFTRRSGVSFPQLGLFG